MNVIPCLAWVKRGVSAAVPDKVQLTPEELEGIIKQTESELQDLEEGSDNDGDDGPSASTAKKGERNQVANTLDSKMDDEYNFENYDNEGDDIHCSIGGLAVINSDGKDPFVTVGDSEDEDSEKDDDIIKPDDNLVLIGHVEGDASTLEIFVYNENESSFYCHHDILLPAFPLCIEWLHYDPSDAKPGNFCAIGDMTPIIQVWDLDLIDCLEPVFKLGKKPKKKKNEKRIGHSDAVLDIAWNTNYNHILASGSVDKTVLLWDLDNCLPSTKLDQFTDKVQSIQWHPTETHHLLTGSADKLTRLFDCRTDNTFKSWETTGEVERVLWNHFDPNFFFISTSDGILECIDSRQGKHVWQIAAHEKEVTGLSLSSSCPGLLVTSSDDGVMKVWDAINPSNLELVWEKTTNLGALQCLSSAPNSPFVFALGGDNKSHNLKLWDLLETTEVAERFGKRELKKTSVAIEKEEEMMDITENIECMALKENKRSK